VPLLRDQIERQVARALERALNGTLHRPGVVAMPLRDRIRVLQGQSHTALAACDVSLVASGTATLEAALFKQPMVIAYKMNWLSWLLMRNKRYQPWVGLPNILCADFVVPEFLQGKASPDVLANAVLDWLNNPQKAAQVRARFTTLHHELRRDTPQLCAQDVAKVLEMHDA
jgi:lipid-A-disaccharide synthase